MIISSFGLLLASTAASDLWHIFCNSFPSLFLFSCHLAPREIRIKSSCFAVGFTSPRYSSIQRSSALFFYSIWRHNWPVCWLYYWMASLRRVTTSCYAPFVWSMNAGNQTKTHFAQPDNRYPFTGTRLWVAILIYSIRLVRPSGVCQGHVVYCHILGSTHVVYGKRIVAQLATQICVISIICVTDNSHFV